jgi:hypothetical protein
MCLFGGGEYVGSISVSSKVGATSTTTDKNQIKQVIVCVGAILHAIEIYDMYENKRNPNP